MIREGCPLSCGDTHWGIDGTQPHRHTVPPSPDFKQLPSSCGKPKNKRAPPAWCLPSCLKSCWYVIAARHMQSWPARKYFIINGSLSIPSLFSLLIGDAA